MTNACVITDTVTLEAWALDVANEIAGSITATPTEHPVELGVAIVDHVQQMPETLVITGMISETPTKAGQDVGATRITRWQSFLRGLALGHPVMVASYRYGTMLNMAFVSCPLAITTDRAVKVVMTLKQIRIVSATLVASVGATNSTNSITNATAKTAGAEAPIDPAALQTALDAANLTVEQNLAAQPTTQPAATTKQTSVAYELAHSMGLV